MVSPSVLNAYSVVGRILIETEEALIGLLNFIEISLSRGTLVCPSVMLEETTIKVLAGVGMGSGVLVGESSLRKRESIYIKATIPSAITPIIIIIIFNFIFFSTIL